MEKNVVILLSVLLLSLPYSNSQVTALTPMLEKENIVEELEVIKNNPEITDKTIKNIENSIKNIKKSLDPKLWNDESTLNLKNGEKMFSAEKKAIKDLEIIIKDKKETQETKNNITEILERLTSTDEILLGIMINDSLESTIDEKTIKKLEKSQEEFEEGNNELVNKEYHKAITHYEKTWDGIQKALKEPHAKKMKVVDESAGDLTGDGIDDIYLKIKNPEKSNKTIKLDLKIKDSCVNGITHDDAAMKMAFMGPGIFITNERLTDEGFDVTNKWFKKNDENQQIDRFTEIITFFSLPPTGDDMIQKNPDSGKGSFDYNGIGISEIGEQTGWEGSIEIKGNPGDYEMVLFFPVTSPSSAGDDCNEISALSVPFTIGP